MMFISCILAEKFLSLLKTTNFQLFRVLYTLHVGILINYYHSVVSYLFIFKVQKIHKHIIN